MHDTFRFLSSRSLGLAALLTLVASGCQVGGAPLDTHSAALEAAATAELAGPCQPGEMGGPGSCKSEPTWIGYATDACEAAGLELGAWTLGEACGKGRYTSIAYECCPPDPCSDHHLGGPTSCKPETTWQAYAEHKCKAQGLTLTSWTLDAECGDGLYIGVDFTCCDEEVCCKTADGPQVVLGSECPHGQELGMDVCQAETCCFDGGGFSIQAVAACDQPVGMDLCAIETCCESPDGYQVLPLAQCPAGAAVPFDPFCQAPCDVCCELDDGYQTVPADECPAGHVVGDELCEPQQDVCCETAIGYQVVPADECPNAQVPMELCEPAGEVCCKINGTFMYLPTNQCPSSQVAGDEMCKVVCCETAAGYQVVPLGLCPGGAAVPMDLCDSTGPCDAAITGQCEGFDYSAQCDPTGFDCGPIGILGDLDCDGKYEVCIECPVGTHPVDTNGDGCEDLCDCCEPLECPLLSKPIDSDGDGCDDACCQMIACPMGTTAVDTDGDGCPDTCKDLPCDEAISGQCEGFDYTEQCLAWGGSCGPDAIFADTDCDGELDVCKLCPAGTHPVDSNGDGCEDMCDCCEPILCPIGTEPTDVDGDGCPDTCKAIPCDAAVSGQCKGFDYTDQCDPGGLDCGTVGIQADLDCDGTYEVCIACPAGTHPVDSNGDGCEDLCGCDDSAGDPILQIKTCAQLGGTTVTTVTGDTACQVGMGAPCNCGQVCDGAVLACP